MRARAVAAAEAIGSTLASLDAGASSHQASPAARTHGWHAGLEGRVSDSAGYAGSPVDMRERACGRCRAACVVLRPRVRRVARPQVADATADAAEAAYDRVADREARQRTDSLRPGAEPDGGTGAAAGRWAASVARGVGAVAGGGGGGGSAALGGMRAQMTSSGSGAAQADSAAGQASAATGSGASGSSEPGPSAEPRWAVSDAVLHQRVYFSAVMTGYMFGLVGAFIANDVTGLGQPALLYIVPTTLGAVALTAASRGEVGRVWSWTDAPSFGVPAADKEKEERA
jgi:hypothetical protein